MKKPRFYAAALLVMVAVGGVLSARLGLLSRRTQGAPAQGERRERPYGIPMRVPWTTSRISGSPDQQLPYRIGRAFPKLTFKNPLLITNAPGTERLFVGEQAGKLYSFPNKQACARADLFLDLTTELHNWDKNGKVKGVEAVYGLAFHPRFARNRYCYVCYVLDSKNPGEQLPDGSRVSRFRVTGADPPRCDPKSEKVLITWMAGGHNGGCLQFGPDGYLYISTGDAADPNPPDKYNTGQDISDLLSSILRIDVDHADKGKAYAVPRDNPFVKLAGARPEVWAYGFRNPWRMSFDRVTGDLWVGDVGWELWEMIYRVKRGGNYGWSIMEGPQPVHPEGKRGPTPISPPALDFPHTEAASITGGYVYRGKRLKGLVGAYICGDWVTRKLWGTRFDGDRVTWHRELAQGTQRIVAFGEDNDAELYFLNYDDVGTIHQLVPNKASRDSRAKFPTRLSETGLFTSVKEHKPAPGVVPFSVNTEQWADYATAERFVALPGKASARVYDSPVEIPGGFYSGQVFFPKDGVLARTVSLEMERGQPRSRRRLETQILHCDGTAWRAYTYAWNDRQTDATLVPAAGATRTLTVTDPQAPGGRRQQTWHFHSRAECLQCHNPWAGYALAFNLPQLNREHDYGGVTDNQLRTLEHIGLVTRLAAGDGKEKAGSPKPPGKFANPYDQQAGLDERARSYLHVNCSHCHQFGAGGTADIDLRYQLPVEETKTLEVRPVQGAFEIARGQLLAPGDPYRSVLFYRMSKLGRGRMPHIGSEIVDERGLRLIHDWIRQLPIRKDERALIEKLRALDESAIVAQERDEVAEQRKNAAEAIARADGRDTVIPEDRQKAEAELKAQAAARRQVRAAERAGAIDRLLSSTSSALMLADAMGAGRIPDAVGRQVLAAATVRAEPQVRDLFERFIPDDQRVKRLGTLIKPEQILSLKGNAARGKELFFKSGGLQCVNCHRVGNTGSTLGPDLSQVGKKYTRAQILENILEPSKTIDPKYATYLAETTDGQVHTGLLAEKTAREVVLRNVGDKEVRIPAGKVERLVPQKTSLMPEQLLRELTAEQAADLVEYLATLK
ncbi:MAG TPA: PQQ-dependent sugar dehydrogenase [Gemmataceae bacterium]|nr:PQQ-dependent sugar dehydrogenase [Gemmataceae bacterium]